MTIELTAALAALRMISWDVELQFAHQEYTIDGSAVDIYDNLVNTEAFSGSTDPWPEVLIDFNGCPSTWPEVVGALHGKFARAGGFLLQAETNFTSFAEFAVGAGASADFSDATNLLQASPSGIALTQPSTATVRDRYACGYRSRIAWLCTPTVSAMSMNGSYPISVSGEVINFAHVGLNIKSNMQFLRMAPPAGISVDQLPLLSS